MLAAAVSRCGASQAVVVHDRLSDRSAQTAGLASASLASTRASSAGGGTRLRASGSSTPRKNMATCTECFDSPSSGSSAPLQLCSHWVSDVLLLLSRSATATQYQRSSALEPMA